jgi:glutamate synthase domain-containing protein 2
MSGCVLTAFVPLILIVVSAVSVLAALAWSAWWWVLAAVLIGAALIAIHDVAQRRHSVLRNYPVVGHLRYLLEKARPELQQYFIERNYDGRPFDRDTRTVIYERAKGIHGEQAFGTEREVNAVGYKWVLHSSAPKEPPDAQPRVRIGGPDCARPYEMALLNVSAMSFGALSANAIRALNAGAAQGGFAHDTGEGALTSYHLEHGGDLIWELGSGYFGARTKDGNFDPEQFRDKAARSAVKCVSLKLSQGAKPGIGGVLPAAKVTKEIAAPISCPVGVATQDPRRARALDVADKTERVVRYQQATVAQAQQMIASLGLSGPQELHPAMLMRRIDHVHTDSYQQLYGWLALKQLLQDPPSEWASDWAAANPDSFLRA